MKKYIFGMITIPASAGMMFFLSGCTPTVQLAAPKDAVKIDVDMKVEVITRKEGGDPVVVTTPAADASPAAESISDNRRNRVSEYQSLLDRGVAGIDRKGLLEMRPLGPQDSDKNYIVQVIDAENKDRIQLLEAQALKEGKPLDRVQSELYERLRESALKSKNPVWIEIQNDQKQWVWKKIP